MFSRFGPCVMAVQGLTVHSRTTPWSGSGSDCVWTVPSEILRRLNFATPLSKRKYHAIWALVYDLSSKVLSQVRYRRFWEFDGVLGGGVPMDLPGRRVVYASHPFHGVSAMRAGRAIHEQPVPA